MKAPNIRVFPSFRVLFHTNHEAATDIGLAFRL